MAERGGKSEVPDPTWEFTVREDESVSEAVIRASSTVSNSDEGDLPPLYHAIAPDALDLICTTCHSLTFSYHGSTVTIIDGEKVELRNAVPAENEWERFTSR